MKLHFRKTRFFLLLCLLLLTACASPKSSITKLNAPPSGVHMLVLPIDVQMNEISVGGVLEPKAEWIIKGEKNLKEKLNKYLSEMGNVIPVWYEDARGNSEIPSQQLLLARTIGKTIFFHYHNPSHNLPAKKDEFSWTMGESSQALSREYNSDYALFVSLVDNFSSAGRVALGLVTAVVFGYAPPPGLELGVAYLIDLRTGDVVWFNYIEGSYLGDAREPEGAGEVINGLLDEFPK